MKKFAFAFGAIVVPFVFACSSAPKTSSTSAADSAQEGEKCGGFVAHPQQCDESLNLYCKYSHVPDVPGTCTSCNGFGALPHFAKICQDGSEDSPHWVAQGGTCQMVVCPNDTTNSDPNACQAPTDCRGLLPHICEQCADGTSQCAHFDCNAGACQTVVCDDNGGPATLGDDGGTGDDASSGDDGGSQPTACNDFNPCPADQTCIDPNTGLPATNGAPGTCQ
jgi:hypothetical protein